MLSIYHEPTTDGVIRLVEHEAGFYRQFFDETIRGNQVPTGRGQRLLTIAWNTGADQPVTIDGLDYVFPAQTVLPLVVNQTFRFERAETVVAWQFDREFYCIIDHDKEVSCSGLLFYGRPEPMFLRLTADEQIKLAALLVVFNDEFATCDNIQGEMLRMLLKRLIITLTRLVKMQYVDALLPDSSRELIRQYRMLVEQHYRQQHQVSFYADKLAKSPKTLTNVFALSEQESPLQIIHERIALEARRLLSFTDKSAKEISYELGFEEVSNFSRFFKKIVGLPPSEFKEKLRQPVGVLAGKLT
ncbi:helix-turn-helix domain-containing protein [Spirosoma aerolatum]|uniref:helix-turn-helix domain-containing protein n=1 Tax=Spirosoma aerolatum TaxID=1211326 RepID=UPI0009AE57C0|nr:AraC family transcriptional regulator [Spirosoma aerolatum]